MPQEAACEHARRQRRGRALPGTWGTHRYRDGPHLSLGVQRHLSLATKPGAARASRLLPLGWKRLARLSAPPPHNCSGREAHFRISQIWVVIQFLGDGLQHIDYIFSRELTKAALS